MLSGQHVLLPEWRESWKELFQWLLFVQKFVFAPGLYDLYFLFKYEYDVLA